MNRLKCIISGLLFFTIAKAAEPKFALDYAATIAATSSTGDFAPYMIGSWNNGLLAEKHSALIDAGINKALDYDKRFSWSAGLEFVAGYSSSANYEKFDNNTKTWWSRKYSPSAFVIQQAYATVKYRKVYLTAGQQNPRSYFVNGRVSSGDLARSNNARGLPGVEAGFVDFVDIPLTNGWVQIDGAISYNKFTDNSFRREQYNYYNDLLATGLMYTYKRVHFRSNPQKQFSATIGMQVGGIFGGKTEWYDRGKLMREQNNGAGLRDYFDMLVPIEGNGDGYYKGSSLGTIDLKFRYRLPSGAELTAYVQNPWEDGSGLGKFNGWDGLWGISYHSNHPAIITDAAVEWIDFTNQSGPIAWQPGDYPGCTQTNATSGGDNYFNNDMYGAYANYGMAIGSPFLVSPVYNLDGTPMFAHNMARGVHIAVAGAICDNVNWRLMYSYQQAWGMGRLPSHRCYINNSAMAEASWTADRLMKGLSFQARAAFDAGSLRGNTFGIFVGITYSGKLTIH